MCICATSPNSDHDSNCKKVDVPCCTSFFAQHATPTYVDQRENVCEGGTLLPALARVSGRRWTCDGSRVQRKGPVGGARRRSPSGFALTAWWNVCSPQAIVRKHVHAVVIVDVLERQLENCSCLAMGARRWRQRGLPVMQKIRWGPRWRRARVAGVAARLVRGSAKQAAWRVFLQAPQRMHS